MKPMVAMPTSRSRSLRSPWTRRGEPMSAARTDVTAARKARIARLAGLYAVTPDIANTALLARNVEAAIAGGAAAIQYRNKRADSALRHEQAHAIARLPARTRTLLIVNDDAALAAAVAAGADYVAFGSFFASATKPAARRASIDVLRRAVVLGVPVVAIGGITSSNASSLIDAGATAVAVITDVFASSDPASITRAAAAIVRACTTERPPASTPR